MLVFQIKEYGPVKHELCGLLLTFSVYSKFFTLVTFNAIHGLAN